MAKRVLVVAAVVVCVAVTGPLRAAVAGILTDAAGIPIRDAKLTIKDGTWANKTIEIETDEHGRFKLDDPIAWPTKLLGKGELKLDGQTVDAKLAADHSTGEVKVTNVSSKIATWNIWPSKEGDKTAMSVPVTERGDYRVHFDLAGLRYGSQIATIEAEKTLQRFLDGGDRRVVVKPLIQGDGLELTNGDPQTLTIDSKKFNEAFTPVDIPKSPSELSEKFAALRVEVQVKAKKPGKARVGLALMDPDHRQVVGLVSADIEVSSAPESQESTVGNSAEPQEGKKAKFQVFAGRDALLQLLSQTGEPALGIGLFSLGDRETVVVVKNKDEIRSWTPRRSIREYVDDDNPRHFGLRRQLESVHCPSWASLDCEEDYSQVASFFSQILFSDPDKNGRDEAKKAMEYLQSLPEDAVVSVGYFNGEGTILPIPLGLLGIERKGAIGSEDKPATVLLGTFATVTQPLPITRLPPDSGCAKDFTAILPASLGLHGADVRPDFDALLRPYRKPRAHLSSYNQLKSFLSPKPPAQSTEPKPPIREGLLLLAHHADGFLSFDADFQQAYLAETIEREFEPGSVAILIGCSVSGLSPLNRTLPLLSTLNEKGIDAMILSPFGVNAQLGARFAVHFTTEIEEARSANKPLPLLKAFTNTIERTRSDASVTPFLAELNEFSVVGAGNLELCPKDTQPLIAPEPKPAPAKEANQQAGEGKPTHAAARRSGAGGCGDGRRFWPSSLDPPGGGGTDTGSGGSKGFNMGPFDRRPGPGSDGCCCCW